MPVLAIALFLTGCGKNVSEDAHKIGTKAIEIIDAVIDYDVSAMDARDKVALLKERMNKVDDEGGKYELNHLLLGTELTILSSTLLLYDMGSNTNKDLEEVRESIKKLIG